MQRDFGHFEEQQLNKRYDLRLLGRIVPFVRPYGRFILIAVVLVIAITLLDLAVPYVTKTAIDRYIVPAQTSAGPADAEGQPGRWVEADANDPRVREIVARHPDLFQMDETTAWVRINDMQHFSVAEVAILRAGDLTGVARMTLLFLGIVILSFAFNFIQQMVMEYTGQMIMHDLRMKTFGHLQHLSLSFFTRNPVGRLVTRVTNDVQNMHELFTSIVVFVFKDLFLLIGIGVVLLYINWRLALVTFAVLPIVLLLSFYFAMRAREVYRTLRIKVAEINTQVSESISGMRVIQLFRQEAANTERFTRLNHENYLAGMQQVHIFAIFMPVIEVLSAVALALIIYSGGGEVMSQQMTLGSLVAFISYIRMFFRPIRDIAEKYNIMQNAMASAERIFLLLDNDERLPQSTVADVSGATSQQTVAQVAFHRVSFQYAPDEPVLSDVSFRIASGQSVAVVGATGSGKTTLINLLVRFYDPDSGSVRINGRDLRELPIEAVRSRLALVTQDPFLFSGSIRDNILLGNPGLDDKALLEIVEQAKCMSLVANLPDGLDHLLTAGGGQISSGQRQLLSIARALAADPDLIILDEATSYIDSQTELQIQQALGNLMSGRTTFMAAHRLSTAKTANRIIVLHRGRIAESGTHRELMAHNGIYAKLSLLQSG